MRIVAAALLFIALTIGAACSARTSSPSPDASSEPDPTASPSPGAGVRVEVRLLDTFRIEPAAMAVPVGTPVTFVVTNAGVLDHEFYVGDETAQQHHEEEMAGMGGMMPHDDPLGIAVDPGASKELTLTFNAPGQTLAGCHVTGHYAAGMKATITIGP